MNLQPSLVALFLFPTEQTVATNAIKSGAQSGSHAPSFLEGKSSGVSGMLWKVLLKSAELVKRLASFFPGQLWASIIGIYHYLHMRLRKNVSTYDLLIQHEWHDKNVLATKHLL